MKTKNVIRVCSLLLALLIAVSACFTCVFAADSGSSSEKGSLVFEESNVTPGDTLTQTFRVYTSFFSKVTLRMGVTIHAGEEGLANQLVFRIRQEGAEEILYEAPASQLQDQEAAVRIANIFGPTEQRTYCAEIYVPAEMGNEYQSIDFRAEFYWEIDEDADAITYGVALLSVLIGAVVILLSWRSKKLAKKKKILITSAVVILALLATLICSTVFSVNNRTLKNLRLSQGSLQIDLNGGEPVLGSDILFEPGMTIRKDFTLENKGTADCFYKIYFTELPEEIAEKITVTILDGTQTIISSTMLDMTKETAYVINDNLMGGEKEVFTLCLEISDKIENIEQSSEYTLDMFIEAVQRDNNADANFGEENAQ